MIQEREFESLGSERTQKVDVRVIAATNRDLRQMVADGRFQEDLYYRLHVIPVHIPPLRERREDIPVLVEHFIAKHAQRAGKRIDGIAPGVMQALQASDWPGNVRELENTMERAVVLSQTPIIGPDAVRILSVSTAPAVGLPSLNLQTESRLDRTRDRTPGARKRQWREERRRGGHGADPAGAQLLPGEAPHRLESQSLRDA